jgi:hypothetical protein
MSVASSFKDGKIEGWVMGFKAFRRPDYIETQGLLELVKKTAFSSRTIQKKGY